MKTAFFGLVALTVMNSASAAPTYRGVTAAQAETGVIGLAHRFISVQAPDFGGSVASPCAKTRFGNQYVVSCNGVARRTMAGDGESPARFKCIGVFSPGQGGLLFQDSPVHCKFN